MRSCDLLEKINANNNIEDFLKELADAQLKITDKTKEGDSILHVFAQSIHVKTFRKEQFLNALIEAGADVNAVDSDRNLFFMRVPVDIREYDVMVLISIALKQLDFNVCHRNKKNESVFETVFSMTPKHENCIKKILEHQDFTPNQRDSQGESPLTCIIKKDPIYRKEYTKVILSHKEFDPQFLNHLGESCLECLLKKTPVYWRENALKIIRHSKFDPKHKDKNGCSYLSLLKEKNKCGWEGLAKELIKKGADPEELINEKFQDIYSSPESINNFSDDFIDLELKYLCEKSGGTVERDTKMFAHLFSLDGKIINRISWHISRGYASRR